MGIWSLDPMVELQGICQYATVELVLKQEAILLMNNPTQCARKKNKDGAKYWGVWESNPGPLGWELVALAIELKSCLCTE